MLKEVVVHNVDQIHLVLQELSVVQVVVEEERIQVLEIKTQEVRLIKCHQCHHHYNLLVLEIQEELVILVVKHLDQDQQVVEVVQMQQVEVVLVEEVEQVEQVKMFHQFLDHHQNLFILQMDQMQEHLLEVFLLVVVEEDKIKTHHLHKVILVELVAVEMAQCQVVVVRHLQARQILEAAVAAEVQAIKVVMAVKVLLL